MDIRNDRYVAGLAWGISMETIRGLIVDDDPENIEAMTSRLDLQFTKLGWRVAWTKTTKADEGQQRITSEGEPFDLVIVDLLFERRDLTNRDEQRGLELISDAGERSSRTFILAVTTGREYLPDLLDEAKQRGAHHALRRGEFSTESKHHSPAAIAAEIREHLLDNGTVTDCEVTSDDRDPAVQGLLHEVGKPTVSRLYSKILEVNGHDTRRMHVRFLTPGVSGAAVCAVTARVNGVGTLSHFLKLSRAGDKLLSEAERSKRAAEVLAPLLLVPYRPAHPVGPVNGWYALGAPLIERATTLRAWLATGPEPTVVEDVLEALFVEGLGPVYQSSAKEVQEPLTSFAFPHYRQRRVLQALDEMKEVLARPDGGNLTQGVADLVANLEAFVIEGRLPRVLERSLPRPTYSSYVHGDLHAANVLVSAGRRPFPQLIDTSTFGRAHWATDPACLTVDLLMRGIDAGAESMFFTGFGTWRTLAARIADGETEVTAVTDTSGTLASLTALSWLAVSAPRICPGEADSWHARHRWEWHAALATYLLRATYQTDLPHPKRALAFVAAHDQLFAATAAVPT